MLSNWQFWMDKKTPKVSEGVCGVLAIMVADQVKERCRKGIPDSLRGRAWMEMSGASDLMKQNEGCFEVSVATAAVCWVVSDHGFSFTETHSRTRQ